MKNLKKNILPIFLILTGSIFQLPAMLKTGLPYRLGIGYWGPLARDGVWHEALVGQLLKSIPPINPGFAGVRLTNYHFLYDALVAILSKVSALPPRYLVYILLPIFISVFLGQAIYYFVYQNWKSKKAATFALFFLYFGSSFGWILGVLRHTEIGGESAFWANQPVSMNLNPPFALSLLVIAVILILLSRYSKNKSIKAGLVIALLSGILIGIKAYAGFIVLFGLFVLSAKRYVFDKDTRLIIFTLIASSISFCIYKLTSSGASSLIQIEPLWLVNTMIDAGDRVGIPALTARRFAYLGDKKYIHYGVIELFSIILFVIGNMGTRIAALFVKPKKFRPSDLDVFMLTSMLAAFVPPFVFVQKGNPWNIVQFFYYFLFFSGIYAGVLLSRISREGVYKKAFFIVLLIITPISSAATFRSWLYPNPPAYLSVKESEALSYLSAQRTGTVLVHPFESAKRDLYKDPYPLSVYADSAYVSAHSGMPVYLEDVEQQIILNTPYEGRLTKAISFFSTKDIVTANQFLENENIDYVYLPKIFEFPNAEEMYAMKKIFENSEVNIYRVLK